MGTCVTCIHFDPQHFECNKDQEDPTREVPVNTIEQEHACYLYGNRPELRHVDYLSQLQINYNDFIEALMRTQLTDEQKELIKLTKARNEIPFPEE